MTDSDDLKTPPAREESSLSIPRMFARSSVGRPRDLKTLSGRLAPAAAVISGTGGEAVT